MDGSDVVTTSLKSRSRVSNGAQLFLSEADGRGKEARRYRDVYHGLLVHLGGDGVSEVRHHLAKRAAALITWCECCEAELASGGNGEGRFDIGLYTTGVNSLRRILSDLGLDPVARDITPGSLSSYFTATVEPDPPSETDHPRGSRRQAPQAAGAGHVNGRHRRTRT